MAQRFVPGTDQRTTVPWTASTVGDGTGRGLGGSGDWADGHRQGTERCGEGQRFKSIIWPPSSKENGGQIHAAVCNEQATCQG